MATYSDVPEISTAPLNGAPTCTARAKATGRQCQKPACKDMAVCEKHGGASPQAIEGAAQRAAAREVSKIALWAEDALPLDNPVLTLASLGGRIQRVMEVLGRQMQGEECMWCGRDELHFEHWEGFKWATKQLESIAATLVRNNIEDRKIKIQHGMVMLLACSMDQALKSAGMDEATALTVHNDFLDRCLYLAEHQDEIYMPS